MFSVLSDDMEWCYRNLKSDDVILTRKTQSLTTRSVEHDMAVGAHCNHSIISFGTFSFWTAFLKYQKGIVIHPKGFWEMEELSSTNLSWIALPDPCQTTVEGKIVADNRTECTDK